MAANERTSLLSAQQNGNGIGKGNGVQKKKDKLIIPMPKDPIFTFENYWGGLSLEELLPYQDDPWWQRLRNTILYTFWLMMLLTLTSACLMAYFHRNSSCKIVNSESSTSSILLMDTLASTTTMSEVITGKLALAPL